MYYEPRTGLPPEIIAVKRPHVVYAFLRQLGNAPYVAQKHPSQAPEWVGHLGERVDPSTCDQLPIRIAVVDCNRNDGTVAFIVIEGDDYCGHCFPLIESLHMRGTPLGGRRLMCEGRNSKGPKKPRDQLRANSSRLRI